MANQVKEAHKASSRHAELVQASERCGCFYCLKVYQPSEIREWIDQGSTALCPHCGIDSVLPEAAGYPLTQQFLKQMESYWFGQGTTYKVVNGELVAKGSWKRR